MRLAYPPDCTTVADVFARAAYVRYLRRTVFRRFRLPSSPPPTVAIVRASAFEPPAPPPRPAVPPPLEEAPPVTPEQKDFADYLAELRLVARPTGIKLIVLVTARYFQVSTSEILGRQRTVRLVRPRHVAMYLAKRLAGRSLPDIGRHMENRDHTTIMHGIRKIERLLAEHDPIITEAVDAITIELGKVMAARAHGEAMPEPAPA